MRIARFAPLLLSLGLTACVTVNTDSADGMMDDGNMNDQMERRMDDMMDDHGGQMDMTMDEMAHSLDGLVGDAFDEAFIRAMIPHHQGAIDMAEAVLENAKHEELKALARDIIEAQQSEIDMMNGWLRDWGYEE